jgi:hypothetical protein
MMLFKKDTGKEKPQRSDEGSYNLGIGHLSYMTKKLPNNHARYHCWYRLLIYHILHWSSQSSITCLEEGTEDYCYISYYWQQVGGNDP